MTFPYLLHLFFRQMLTLIWTGHNQVTNLICHNHQVQQLLCLSIQLLQHQLLCHSSRRTQPHQYSILLCSIQAPQHPLLLCTSTIPTQALPILLCPTQHLHLLCPSTMQTQVLLSTTQPSQHPLLLCPTRQAQPLQYPLNYLQCHWQT